MASALPRFRFHPDPVLSGAFEPADDPCDVCGQARGLVYTGPCYVEDDFDAVLCPWCIADGSAFARYGVTFHELSPRPGLDLTVAEEIEERTPGLLSSNPIEWPLCCEVPMAYLEPAGQAELLARHPRLAAALPTQVAAERQLSKAAAEALVAGLRRDEPPCAQVFRCGKCRTAIAILDDASDEPD